MQSYKYIKNFKKTSFTKDYIVLFVVSIEVVVAFVGIVTYVVETAKNVLRIFKINSCTCRRKNIFLCLNTNDCKCIKSHALNVLINLKINDKTKDRPHTIKLSKNKD